MRKIIENILEDTDPGGTKADAAKRSWMLWHFLYIIWWESTRATKRSQGGNGPARGLPQMEPATLYDLIKYYILGPTKGLIANLAKAAGVTEKQMRAALDAFIASNKPPGPQDKPLNTWPTTAPAAQLEIWIRDIHSFAVKMMRYLFKTYGNKHAFPPAPPTKTSADPQGAQFKGEHSDGWATWWKRAIPGENEEEQAEERKRQRDNFEERAADLDKVSKKPATPVPTPGKEEPKPKPTKPIKKEPDPPKDDKSPGGCFIATSVYGEHSWQTNALRRFRDERLLPHAAGRLFTRGYYRVSPRIATWTDKSPRLRGAARLALNGVVRVLRLGPKQK